MKIVPQLNYFVVGWCLAFGIACADNGNLLGAFICFVCALSNGAVCVAHELKASE